MASDPILTAEEAVERALSLLVNASRVDPVLRGAVQEVEDAYRTLRDLAYCYLPDRDGVPEDGDGEPVTWKKSAEDGWHAACVEQDKAETLRAERDALARKLEFLEILADGAPLAVNGIPWREAFERLNAIVSDPVEVGRG